MANPQCSPQRRANTECSTLLTCDQILGLLITAEAGFLSFGAVLLLFGKITRNVLRNMRRPPDTRSRFFKSPLDVYMLSLLTSDLIQGLGLFLNIKWVAQGTVLCGTYCKFQGVMQQMGETSVAMATLAIAAHTFSIIFFRKGARGIIFAVSVVCTIWLYVILFITISAASHGKEDDGFYTPTPYWCWVGSRFNKERIAGEYFWIWFTALVSLALYVPLFFCLRGNIIVDEKRRWKVRFRRRPTAEVPGQNINLSQNSDPVLGDNGTRVSKRPAKEAFTMLLYPVCYVMLILPLSVGRWISFSIEARHPPDPNNVTETIPSAVTFAVTSIFGLSGLVNVLLLIMTRPGLLLLSEGQNSSSPAHFPAFPPSDRDNLGEHTSTSALYDHPPAGNDK